MGLSSILAKSREGSRKVSFDEEQEPKKESASQDFGFPPRFNDMHPILNQLSKLNDAKSKDSEIAQDLEIDKKYSMASIKSAANNILQASRNSSEDE